MGRPFWAKFFDYVTHHSLHSSHAAPVSGGQCDKTPEGQKRLSQAARMSRARARMTVVPLVFPSFRPLSLASIAYCPRRGLSDPSCCRTTFPVRAQRNQGTCTFSLSINDWILVSYLDYIGLGTCRRSGGSHPPQC